MATFGPSILCYLRYMHAALNQVKRMRLHIFCLLVHKQIWSWNCSELLHLASQVPHQKINLVAKLILELEEWPPLVFIISEVSAISIWLPEWQLSGTARRKRKSLQSLVVVHCALEAFACVWVWGGVCTVSVSWHIDSGCGTAWIRAAGGLISACFFSVMWNN